MRMKKFETSDYALMLLHWRARARARVCVCVKKFIYILNF